MKVEFQITSVVDAYREIFNQIELLSRGRIEIETCRNRIREIARRAQALGLGIQVPSIEELERDYLANKQKKIEAVLNKLDGVQEEEDDDWCQPSYEEDPREDSYQ